LEAAEVEVWGDKLGGEVTDWGSLLEVKEWEETI
jgi:hypothetical protein